MSTATCPFCNAGLPPQEVVEGWCEACGKKLPPFVRGAVPDSARGRLAEQPPERAEADGPYDIPSGKPPRGRLRVQWGWFAGLLIFVPFGLSTVCHAILDDSPRSPSTSRRWHAVEGLFGIRGAEALGGLVLLGAAVYSAYRCLKNATKAGTAVVGVLIGLCSVATLAAWITPAVLRANEAAWQRRIGDELKELPFGEPTEEKPFEVPIRHKVLVWDRISSTLSKTQGLLPADRSPHPDDAAFTVILILKTADEETAHYDSGEVGVTRTMTVGVIDYPEKKVQGCYLVRGESPGWIEVRPAGELGPIVGDTAKPLKNWIESKGASR